MKFRNIKKKRVILFSILLLCIISATVVVCKYTEVKDLFLSLTVDKPTYTVVFNANGGTGTMANQTFTYDTSQNLRTNTFTKTNYLFDSWNTEEDGSGTSYTDAESVNNLSGVNGATINLYAQWIDNNITITFDGNGGTTPSFESKTVSASSPYGELPTTSKSGYTFFGWSDHNLPAQYQEVDYLQFNTGNYIDTGIIPSNHKVEIKFDFDEYKDYDYLFSTKQYYYFYSYNNKYYYTNNSGSGGTWTTGAHTLIYNDENGAIILDDTELATGLTLTASTNLYIGRQNYNFHPKNYEGKVYYVKITDKSTGDIVREYIPCYIRGTGEAGLYDLVSGVFYSNNDYDSSFTNGSDIDYITPTTELKKLENHTLYAIWGNNPTITFEANGGTVSPSSKVIDSGTVYGNLPQPNKTGYSFEGWKSINTFVDDDYQQVEYIRFNGGTYIDTGIVPIDHKIETKFDFEEYAVDENLFGTSSGMLYLNFGSYNNKYRTGGQGANYYGTWTTGTHTLIYNGDDSEVRIDDNLLNSGIELYSLNNLWIGANTSVTSSSNTNLNGKIYYFKITNKRTGELERYFVPVYRKSDNEIGLYDVVHNKFYPNEGSGTFQKGINIDYITSESTLISHLDHTLYAIWEKNDYQVDVTVTNGTVDTSSRNVYENSESTFNLTPDVSLVKYIVNVNCTNNQKATITNNILTVKNVTSNTTCTVTYSDPGSTVLYTDGTLIINEASSDRAANIALHGVETNEYAPFSNENSYIFTSNSSALWYGEKANITRIEIGQEITPISTRNWFYSLTKVSSGDLSNLNTSQVKDMTNMFYYVGSDNSINTTFTLTGLENWDTSQVIDMTYMFAYAGTYAKTWSIGSLSNWNFISAYKTDEMFYYAAYNATTSSTSIGTLDLFTNDAHYMFDSARYINATLNINGDGAYLNYTRMFQAAAKGSASITVNYDCALYNINDIIATQSTTSHVYKGTSYGTCSAKLVVSDGGSDYHSKHAPVNSNISFTITPDNVGSVPAAYCTNNQTVSISGNTLTISSIDTSTICNVYYEDATVLYNDGTLIINESSSNRSANQTLHSGVLKIYEPFSSENNYVFTSYSNVLWYNDKDSILRTEIGHEISPTSTAYWFYGLKNMASGDFTNLNTSNVTDMSQMFSSTGEGANNASTTFILTGLDSWNTENVENMSYMFYRAGYNARTWNIGDLSGWSNEKVTTMDHMFYYAGYNASTSFTSISSTDGFNVYATNLTYMFANSRYIKATLNVYSNPTSWGSIFSSAANQTNALITVNYSSAATNIDTIINSKPASSHVEKGIQLD